MRTKRVLLVPQPRDANHEALTVRAFKQAQPAAEVVVARDGDQAAERNAECGVRNRPSATLLHSVPRLRDTPHSPFTKSPDVKQFTEAVARVGLFWLERDESRSRGTAPGAPASSTASGTTSSRASARRSAAGSGVQSAPASPA